MKKVVFILALALSSATFAVAVPSIVIAAGGGDG
jgi:hypothetical protein